MKYYLWYGIYKAGAKLNLFIMDSWVDEELGHLVVQPRWRWQKRDTDINNREPFVKD